MNLGINILYRTFSASHPEADIKRDSFYYNIKDKMAGNLEMANGKDIVMQILRKVQFEIMIQ